MKLFFCLLGGQNNPIDQNLEFNKNLRGSAENWLVFEDYKMNVYTLLDIEKVNKSMK